MMNVKTLLLIGFIALTTIGNAQSKYIKEANTKYRSQNFCEAAEKCALAYSKISRKSGTALNQKGQMAFMTAECYRNTDRAKEANEWYDRAVLLRFEQKEPLVLLYNADMLLTMREFKKAKENYAAYKALVPDDARADIGIKNCDEADEYKERRTRHTVTNVKALNKEGFEMAPMFVDKKDLELAFSTTSYAGIQGNDTDPRSCEKYFDIFVSKIDKKGNFTAPAPIEGDSINTEDNEGTICVDGRGKTMFFTRCPNVKKQNLGCDIWMSEAGSKGWEKPTKLSLKASDSISVGHPCVSEDGKFLIFASDLPGGMGGKDLWYTSYDKKSASWVTPINMGAQVNTAGDELFPTFAKNGDLVFASNGLPGMGGLDMYRAERVGTENKWQNPQNYGAPINSEWNDYALVEVDDRKGYFTSERKGGTGADQFKPDLWMYELPPNLFSLKVIVADLSDKSRKTKLEGTKVIVTGKKPGEKWEGVTASDGSVYWDKKPNGDRFVNEESDYKITISKEKFYEDTLGAKISTAGLKYDQDFVIDMGLLPIKPIRLPEVRYALGSYELLVDSSINSKDSLLFVYDLLEEFPGLVLELSSHTDPRGSDAANQQLSENRAKSCYKFLVEEKGVDPRRIVPVGKGEREPRTVYLFNGQYVELEPKGADGKPEPTAKAIQLTEAYMNQFKKTDKKLFEVLQQFNRRTEGKVVTLTYNPATAPAANPDYLIYKTKKVK